jgi:hypothetical protein
MAQNGPQIVRQHKLAGNPVPIWENGQVVWIQPEDIDVDS